MNLIFFIQSFIIGTVKSPRVYDSGNCKSIENINLSKYVDNDDSKMVENAKYYINYTNMYNDTELNSWTCKYCSDRNKLDKIKIFQDSLYDSKCFIGINMMRKEIIMSFKPTTSEINKNLNMLTLKVDFYSNYTTQVPGKVHYGFLEYYKSLHEQYNEYFAELVAQHPDYKIVSVGFSLGSVASLLGALEAKFQHNKTPIVYNYGQPLFGDEAFVDYVKSHINIVKFVNSNDCVTLVSPQNLFAPYYAKFVIDKNNTYSCTASSNCKHKFCHPDLLVDFRNLVKCSLDYRNHLVAWHMDYAMH